VSPELSLGLPTPLLQLTHLLQQRVHVLHVRGLLALDVALRAAGATGGARCIAAHATGLAVSGASVVRAAGASLGVLELGGEEVGKGEGEGVCSVGVLEKVKKKGGEGEKVRRSRKRGTYVKEGEIIKCHRALHSPNSA
jgi:hypothetical protein